MAAVDLAPMCRFNSPGEGVSLLELRGNALAVAATRATTTVDDFIVRLAKALRCSLLTLQQTLRYTFMFGKSF
jgi:hypothetical protein